MSEYNAKNYTEQGGEVTHIGGKIVYDNGLMPNMSTADVASDTVAKVRTSLNALITKLKNAGLMVGDAFTMQYAAVMVVFFGRWVVMAQVVSLELPRL